MSIKKWQTKYILGGLFVSPFFPFLYAQGKFVRYKVGRLPDAEGEITGKIGESGEQIKLLAVGESTVAGVGAKNHNEALTGQFAKHLSVNLSKTVHWQAVGESGINVEGTLERLVPVLPEENLDLILVALGGNDVFELSSPKKWRRNMSRLLEILHSKYPNATILLANVPMVRDFIALPNPLRYVLSRLAKLHHFNLRDLVCEMENIYYFDDIKRVEDDFFSDGIHPSTYGYDLWAEAMVEFLLSSQNRER